jgi:parallel beta-helix repeat protein
MSETFRFYISPSGNDLWSGRLPDVDTAGGDGPFATPAGARGALRRLRSAGQLTGAVEVLLRGGKYFLAEPLVLGPEDGGTQAAPVTYAAYPGEFPGLSGGRPVTGWQVAPAEWGLPAGVHYADLPESRGGRWKFRQLFAGGQRQAQARWPRSDPADPICGGWAYMEDAAAPGSLTAFRMKPGDWRAYAHPEELEVHYYTGPGCWPSRVAVAAADSAARSVTLAQPGLQFDVPGWYQTIPFNPDLRYCLYNGLEDLQAPGDWCFDSAAGRLYFWPGENLGEVVVPLLDCLVDLRGAAWVTLAGLTFTETHDGDNYLHEGVEGAGAMYPHPGWRYASDAVRLYAAEHCTVRGCHFDQVGGNGVYVESSSARNLIMANEFSAAGANSIVLIGTRMKHPAFNRVCDNHIHDGGVFNQYTAGVFLGVSDGNLVHHNRIERLPHHAINLSNNPFGRNVLEYNAVHFVDQRVNDSGAINVWMEEPPDPNVQRCGHVIRYNLITDTYPAAVVGGRTQVGEGAFASGIYLDNYTSNCFVYGNIVVRAASGGIILHAGKNNWIENNILVDCLYGLRLQDYISAWPFWKPMSGFMTGNHFIRNIVASTRPGSHPINLYNWTENVLAQCDGNLYFIDRPAAADAAAQGPGGAFIVQPVSDAAGLYAMQDDTLPEVVDRPLAWARWQALGFDLNSAQGDPLFADPARGDFTLRAESPALAMGFQALTFQPGPRRSRLAV